MQIHSNTGQTTESHQVQTPGFIVVQLLSLLKLMSIESVMPCNHLILCHPISSCSQSFPASGSFPMSQLFAPGGQSIGASASASVLQWIFRVCQNEYLSAVVSFWVLVISVCHDAYWKKSVFIPIPKKCNAKECSNYRTITLISQASRVMLKNSPSQASVIRELWTSRCSSWF